MTRVSIGLHVHAEPASLQATLEHLRAHTPSDAALLLLPDGPDAAVSATLRALQHLPQLATDEPRGAAACFNRLAAASSGADVLILLESGSLVGPGWLDALLAALEADPRNGLAGPSTNAAWNEQCAFPGRGSLAQQVVTSAREAAVRFTGRVHSLEPLYSVADFCFAVRRDVIEAIGAADDGYGLGPCWEMDYAIRAARAGFRSVWACAAYVHRLPFTPRRQLEEQRRFEVSKRRYQDHFCGLRLRGERTGEQYEPHCRGDACEHFAPRALIQLHRPLPAPAPDPAPSPAPAPATAVVEVRDARPLVSCIMPTRDRPAFVQQAIRLFQRQDFPARELIIVDDSATDALGDLVRDEPGVRYLHVTSGHSIGSKRNQAVRAARGELIAQWDDDDWYAPQRLSAQVAPILAGRADVTGLDGTVFFDLDRWAWWTCSPGLHQRLFVGDVHGGTLVFRRRVWEQLAQYPDRSLAEDAVFLLNAVRRGARLHKIPGDGLFVYLRHADNSWSFRCGTFLDPRGWQRLAQPTLPADDLAFYAARSAAAPPAAIATLVSCIMPTANRRPWVPYAIDYFLRQDFPTRELVVLDDGDDAIEDLMPADERVRYLRIPRCASLGAKRNLCVEAARGEVLLHWDDDDWMAPQRIRRQLDDLQASGAEVGGMRRLVYHRLGTPETFVYDYPANQRPWVLGCTLIYTRDMWRRSPFPGVTVGEDTRFLFSQRLDRLAVTADDRLYVGMIHPRNTGPKTCSGPFWSRWPGDIRTILGADASRYLGAA